MKARLSKPRSSRSVFARRCSRETGMLVGWMTYASMPRARSQRANQKPSRPASKATAMRVIVQPALPASSRQRSSRRSNACSSGPIFFSGCRSIPGTIPPTSQVFWLSSTTTAMVALHSKGTRDRLRSFEGRIGHSIRVGHGGENAFSSPVAPYLLILGPKFSAKERKRLNLSRFYAIAQIEYCRNFIFKRHFPIHKLFERSCELGLWRLTADKIAEIFGARLNRRMRGKLATVIDRIEHGHHVFRAYFKNAFLKQYEKFATFLRNELVSNNLADFQLKKGLDHLLAVRERFQDITGRFAGFQAQWLNVHVDFPLLQRLAITITVGAVRYPGIKIHDPRVIRLLEVLLHGGSHVGGWTAKQIHQAVLTTFHLSDRRYGLNQLRYDLRRLRGHGLLQRDGSRYAYRLTPKGVQVALLFLFFHKRLCGPLAHSRFHHRPAARHQPASRLEAAYHRADTAIQRIVDLLAA